MKFIAPPHTDSIYLARGPVDVKRPAQGEAYVTVTDPTQADLAHLGAAGFIAAQTAAPKAEKPIKPATGKAKAPVEKGASEGADTK